MLRLAVIVLLLANAGYFVWSQGELRSWGYAPQEQAEPQRLNEQIRPETLQILRTTPSKTSAASAPESALAATSTATTTSTTTAVAPPPAPAEATECLQAGVFDERQATALREAAAGLPPDSWGMDPSPIAGRWMVYMGKFDDADTLDKKRAELRARNVAFDRATGPWGNGLSLGRFSSEEAAKRELANLNSRGVRTARVILERPESPGFVLRLPAVTSALRPMLNVLRPAMAGKTLRACG